MISWGLLSVWYSVVPIIVGMAGLLIYRFQKRMRIKERLNFALFTSRSKTKDGLKLLFNFIALLAIGIGILRPQWGEQEEMVRQEGRDLVFALDISRSMLAQDMQPNRLEFAKKKIKDLTANLPSERVGLLLFAGSAFVYCPLTPDHKAFNNFLATIESSMVSSGTTDIAQALEKAIAVFDKRQHAKSKLLVVVTDGEDFSPHLEQVREQALQKGITIYTLGVGTSEGAPVPVLDQLGQNAGFQQDERGEVVVSRRNDALLTALSNASGAVYIPATADTNDIAQLKKIIDAIEREKFEEKAIARKKERAHFCAAIAAVCLLFDWIL